jgi:hypothetical protein
MIKTLISVLLIILCTTVKGQTWTPVGTRGFTPTSVGIPSMDIDKDNNIYVAYSNASNVINVMKYNGSTWSALGSTVGTVSFAGASLKLAVDTNGIPHVAFNDGSNSSKLSVKKFNGTTWINVGPTNITTSGAYFISMTFNKKTNIPYISFQDGGLSKVAVVKLNGSSWTMLDNNGIAAGTWTSIAVDTINAIPYVAYQDNALNPKGATVKKFNGTSWSTVGTQGFTQQIGPAQNIQIEVDKNSIPYVSCNLNGNSAYIYKFNGTSWETLGMTPLFLYTYCPIVTDTTGKLFTFLTNSSGYSSTVMKYESSSWTTIGNTPISNNDAYYTSIKINNSNIPYLLFADGGNGGKATVMKYTEATLPLILQSFTAIIEKQKTTLLTWTTASETNTDFFEIQRSIDGVNFKPIGKTLSNGNSSTSIKYSFSDKIKDINANKMYYRLKMIDNDGKFKLSNIISVSKSVEFGYSIIPNPISSFLTLNSSSIMNANISIIDINGKVMYTGKWSNSSTHFISLDRLTGGTYIVKVYTDNQVSSKSFIVVNKN